VETAHQLTDVGVGSIGGDAHIAHVVNARLWPACSHKVVEHVSEKVFSKVAISAKAATKEEPTAVASVARGHAVGDLLGAELQGRSVHVGLACAEDSTLGGLQEMQRGS
jgi:hypothetical protein